jgi:hypothetical protein
MATDFQSKDAGLKFLHNNDWRMGLLFGLFVVIIFVFDKVRPAGTPPRALLTSLPKPGLFTS